MSHGCCSLREQAKLFVEEFPTNFEASLVGTLSVAVTADGFPFVGPDGKIPCSKMATLYLDCKPFFPSDYPNVEI
jgi:hypothetical protein